MVMAAGTICSLHNKLITNRAVECWDLLKSRYGLANMWDTCLCLAEDRYNSSFYIKTLEAQMKDDLISNIEVERSELKVAAQVAKVKSKDNLVEDSRWYLITFTNKPTELDPYDLIKRTMKVVNSKQVSPLQWAYSIEIQPGTGTPHTHIVVESSKYFDWGKIKNFNGGRQANVQRERWNVKNYAIKDETKPSKEWLSKYGLETWFFHSDNYKGPTPNESSESVPQIVSWS